jgi:hypothetical protein
MAGGTRMSLTLRITNADGATLASATGGDEVLLVYPPDYLAGDTLAIETDAAGCFVILQLDDALPPALLFLNGTAFRLSVPFGARRGSHSPRVFSGGFHVLTARLARPEEIAARRNLAFNPFDHHENSTLFPHASANVETRGEATFAARNAIDGQKASDNHGQWPWTSWGIDQNPEAALTLEFGRAVRIDEVVIHLRADFPHDAWWSSVSLSFSDGSSEILHLDKTSAGQRLRFKPRCVHELRLHDLIKADDPSPFPALTQIEIWGSEA